MVPRRQQLAITVAGRKWSRHSPIARTARALLLLGFLLLGQGAAAAPARIPAGLRGPQPFLVVLCRFPDVPGEPRSAGYFRQLFGPAYPGLDNYWREASYGAISLEGTQVLDWRSLAVPLAAYKASPTVDPDREQLAKDCISTVPASVRLDAYKGLGLMFNAEIGKARTGQACLTRDATTECYTVMWIGASDYTSQATVAHELGHAFGLKHSSVGDDRGYGNPWDVMSVEGPCGLDPDFGRIAQHPIAYDKELLGWIPMDKKYVANPGSQATVRLDALSLPQGDGYLLAEIPIGGSLTHFYTVEARRRLAYDAGLPGDAVVIHEINSLQKPPARPVAAGQATDGATASGMWTVGSVFSDPVHGVAVSVDQGVANGFVVSIFTRALPWQVSPARHAVMAARDARFAWQPVAGAAAYVLELSRADGTAQAPAITRQVAGTTVTMTLAPGNYEWRVRGLPDGPWTPRSSLTLKSVPGAWRPAGQVGDAFGVPGTEPSVAIDAEGNVHAAWISNQLPTGRTAMMLADRRSDGVWTPPEQVGAGEAPGDGQSPAIGVDAGGSVYAAWADGTNRAIHFSYRTAHGAWHPDERVDDGVQSSAPRSAPAIAVDGRGNSYALWTDGRNSKPDVYFAYRPAQGHWGANAKVTDDASLPVPDSARVAVDLSGNAYAAWTDARSGQPEIYFAYRPAGGPWGQNVRLNDDAPGKRGSPAIAVDSKGSAYVLWQDYKSCSQGKIMVGDVYFAVRSANGTWGTSERVTTGGRVGEGTQLGLAVDMVGNAYAVWQERLGHAYTLRSAYRPYPGTPQGLDGSQPGAWTSLAMVDRGASSDAPLSVAITVDVRGNAYLTWATNRDGASRVLFADAALPAGNP